MAARALYSASSAYSAVRKDREEEKQLSQAGKAAPQRRARMVPENWQPCWEKLRALDKWSGAAADPDISALLEEEKGAGEGRAGRSSGDSQTLERPALQGIQTGHSAAKRMAYEQTKKEQDAFAEAMKESNEDV